MMNWIAIIETDTTNAIHIKAVNFDSAVRRLHIYLKAQQPERWSDNWEDLRDDFYEGNQEIHGPFDEIPTLI